MAKRDQDYKWCGVLYPDSDTYKFELVLDNLKSYFSNWYYIIHDEDKESDGNYKKTHIHWVGVCKTDDGKNSPVPKAAVATALGVADNYIQDCRSLAGAVQYLAHANDDDKHPYPIESIQSNSNISKYFKKQMSDIKAGKIAQYILETRPITVAEVVPWVLEHKMYPEFRRGFAIWHSIIREFKEEERNEKDQKSGSCRS